MSISKENPALDAALGYAARGWPVFPCPAGSKAPATRHGYRDATTDPGRITAWFGTNPDRNVAIATGAPGPDVLDVDQHGPGPDGYRALAVLAGARADRRRGRNSPHPQRRPARLLRGHRPAQPAPAPPPPGLPRLRRLRPCPAIPGRRQGL
jgi:hypothetical protein